MDETTNKSSMKYLLEEIKDAQILVDKLPDLRRSSYPRLALENLVKNNEKTKANLIEKLIFMEAEANNLINRIGFPPLLAVIGSMSSGKSSLLNSIFYHHFNGNIPSALLREEDNTSVDKIFSYITHNDYADRFKKSENIDVISSDNSLFQKLNFIDTPGTGWKPYTEKGVNDLLSAADIVLFVCTPQRLLDDLSVKLLSMKYEKYPDVPIWYIVTFADSYCRIEGDFETIDIDNFQENLINSVKKLKEIEYGNKNDEKNRDIVLKNIHFEADKNTFLVSNKYRYNTKLLFKKLIGSFDSEEAIRSKSQQVENVIRTYYNRFDKIIKEAMRYVSILNEDLQSVCFDTINRDVNMYIETSLKADTSSLQDELLVKLQGNPIVKDGSSVIINPVPIGIETQTPEIVILRRRLDDYRNLLKQDTFELNSNDIILNRDIVGKEITAAISKIIDIVSQRMEDQIENIEKLGKDKHNLDPFNIIATEEILKELESILKEINLAINNMVDEKRKFLISFYQERTSEISDLYNSKRIDKTIFQRQVFLLKQMEKNIPDIDKDAKIGVDKAYDGAISYVEIMFGEFKNTVISRLKEVKVNADKHLARYVFEPVAGAIGTLFDKKATRSYIEKTCREINISYEPVENKLNDDMKSIKKVIKNIRQNNIEECSHVNAAWFKEFQYLNNEFNKILEEGENVKSLIDQNINTSQNTIDQTSQRVIQKVDRSLERLGKDLIKQLKNGQKIIHDVIKAKRKRRVPKLFAFLVGIILAPILPLLNIIGSQLSDSVKTYSIVAIVVAIIAIAAPLISKIFSQKSENKNLSEKIYREQRKKLMSDIRNQMSEKRNELISLINDSNNYLRSELNRNFTSILNSSEDSNSDLVKNLDDQITVAVKLTLETTKLYIKRKESNVNAITGATNKALYELAIELRKALHKELVNGINEYTDNYTVIIKNLINEFSQIDLELEKLNILLRANQKSQETTWSGLHS